MFAFWFHVAWGSCAIVWLFAFAAFSWEVWHHDATSD